MIAHTKAYLRFREQGRDLLDYAVLLAYALPTLEEKIAPLTGRIKSVVKEPYFFQNPNLTAEDLKARLKKAGDAFGREIIISTFSYFDAYFVDMLRELIAFHGGATALVTRSKRTLRDSTTAARAAAPNNWKKLIEYQKPNLLAKYQKHARPLKSEGFPFPSARMSALGWKHLESRLKRLKSVDFPQILEDALLFEMTAAEVAMFDGLRDKRNKIAHGRLSKYNARTAIEDGIWLRNMAVRIDKHAVENFLVIEP
jgi:hypothetical protein